MSILMFAGRGGLAGACAGLVSGLFSLVFAEATIDRAIELEHGQHGGGAELFTRNVQHAGLVVASVLAGVAIGILYGVVYAMVHRRDPQADPWARALGLAGAGFLGVSVLPFLRYPANPPGAGDPATIDARTAAWLAAIVIGLATVAAAGEVRSRLRSSAPMRDLATAGVVLLGVVTVFLLPAPPDEVHAPAGLLWTFRLCSLASIAILWWGLGIGFGLAGVRAARISTRIPTT
jgi:hypothetical protein